MEEHKEQLTNNNARGERTTRISGDKLKSHIKSGKMPSQ